MSLRSLAVLVLLPFTAITLAAFAYDGGNGFAKGIKVKLSIKTK